MSNLIPIRRSPTARPHERSSLVDVSARDADSVGRTWKSDAMAGGTLADLQAVVYGMKRELDSLRKRFGGGAAGIHWADPRTYDFDKKSGYTEDELVVVLPLSAAVTAGKPSADAVDEGDTIKAKAGTWVCIKDAKRKNVGTTESPVWEYHLPRWPLPVPDDPDNEANYWWPMPLYLELRADCDENGTKVDNYYQVQKKTTSE